MPAALSGLNQSGQFFGTEMCTLLQTCRQLDEDKWYHEDCSAKVWSTITNVVIVYKLKSASLPLLNASINHKSSPIKSEKDYNWPIKLKCGWFYFKCNCSTKPSHCDYSTDIFTDDDCCCSSISHMMKLMKIVQPVLAIFYNLNLQLVIEMQATR